MRLIENAGIIGMWRLQPCERDLCADRCADRHEQRQRAERVEVFQRRRGKILVQDGVGRQRLGVAQQIHQGESEVVENVDSRHLRVELDGVE